MNLPAGDEWNMPPAASPLPGGIIRSLLEVLRGPTEADQLRVALMRAQLAELTGPQAFSAIDLERALLELGDRADVVCLGPRGSGKTATAWTLAATFAALHGLRLCVPGWPPDRYPVLPGITYTNERDSKEWHRLQDAVVLIDEAALVVGVGKRDAVIWEALALARHRNLSTFWTSQDAASLRRELLRLDPTLIWSGVPAWSQPIDRPELAQAANTAGAVLRSQNRTENVGARAMLHGGRWWGFDLPLPPWFNDSMSRNRRASKPV